MVAFTRIFPAAVISDDFNEHKARGSVNCGTDYAVPYGTPVPAAADGTVVIIKTNNSGAAGRYIIIDHGDAWTTEYLHLSGVWVKAGQRVAAGNTIGTSGASGYGSDRHYGAHVHVTASHGGAPLNNVGNVDFETLIQAKPAAAPAPAVITVPAVFRREIKIGSKGEAVKLLQQKLGITADGIFGKITKSKVIAFQKAHGLVADGIVGVKTWGALG